QRPYVHLARRRGPECPARRAGRVGRGRKGRALGLPTHGHRGPRRADRKKKATFHVTPAPASPRTALPPAAPHTSDGRAREATSPAAAAHHAGGKRRAASSTRRRQGLRAGGGCWTAGAAEGGTAEETNAEERGGTAEALPAMGNPLSVHTERS